jgi:hypothetical protein
MTDGIFDSSIEKPGVWWRVVYANQTAMGYALPAEGVIDAKAQFVTADEGALILFNVPEGATQAALNRELVVMFAPGVWRSCTRM